MLLLLLYNITAGKYTNTSRYKKVTMAMGARARKFVATFCSVRKFFLAA